MAAKRNDDEGGEYEHVGGGDKRRDNVGEHHGGGKMRPFNVSI